MFLLVLALTRLARTKGRKTVVVVVVVVVLSYSSHCSRLVHTVADSVHRARCYTLPVFTGRIYSP